MNPISGRRFATSSSILFERAWLATDYRWSSARAHADLVQDDLLDSDRPFPGPIGGWRQWLTSGIEDEMLDRLRRNTASGKPTGNEEFSSEIEQRLGRSVRPRRHGSKVSP